MYDLNEHIRGNQATERWLIKNKPLVYDEVVKYCKGIKDINFSQKLWHYQNQISNPVLCANAECSNQVKFKGRWTAGYYRFCCQACSVGEVEAKKAQLNYSRASKLSKEEKAEDALKKEDGRQKRNQRTLEKKQEILDKDIYYKTISVEEYKKLSESVNGIYTREKFVRENMPHIHTLICGRGAGCEDISFVEKAYMFKNDITCRPKCLGCDGELQFKNKSVGYSSYCSVSCASSANYDQARITMLANSGASHHSMLPHNIEKRKSDKFDKVREYVGLDVTYDEASDSFSMKCDRCDKVHEIPYKVLTQRIYLELDWRDCVTGSYSTSSPENEMKEYIQSIYGGEVVHNCRSVLGNGKEIDMYLPELKVGIEYNGLYFHSEVYKAADYHHDKWMRAEALGVKLVQVYGDEWAYKKDIVKSRIANLLGAGVRKIHARKCNVREVDFGQTREFLIANHLQGSVNASVNVGLYYNDELVSVMTFGRPRKGMRYDSAGNVYELYRFCSKLGCNVAGAASRLFKHFVGTYSDIDEVYSFSALEWPGAVYERIGMALKSTSNYSYWYIEKDMRFSRHNYTKDKLVAAGYDGSKTEREILKDRKIFRIYGAGNRTYVWKRN